MNEFSQKKIALIVTIVLFVALVMFFCFSLLFASIGVTAANNAMLSQQAKLVMNTKAPEKTTIIIDAGHGGEDPGACDNDCIEKTLNLEIAQKLCEFMQISGYNVVMTRTDDRLLYEPGQEDRKKLHDLANRLALATNYEDAVFVSIHMNKFPVTKYKGLQVFYSPNHDDSVTIAENIQTLTKHIMPDNNRKIKQGINYSYILERIDIPAVLVECGFLSNPEDAANLSDENYQKSLAFLIYCAIEQYIGGQNEG